MASLPLRCTICAEQKLYSDISHMLTHIGSKGHLTALFKVQIQAPQNMQLAHRLKEYEQWYEENNLAELLAERMAKKGQKKAAVKMENGGRLIKEEHTEPLGSSRPPNPQGFPLDPSIGVKQEPDTERNDLSRGFESYPDGERRPDYPYATRSRQSLSLDNQSTSDTGFPPPDTWGYGHIQRSANSSNHFSASSRVGHEIKDEPDSPSKASGQMEVNGDGSKLKGTVWPGMGIFDAASPDGKRMRNQKKNFDSSIYLEAMSGIITAREIVHEGPDWHIREDREITGEASPPPEWIVSPVKRPRRSALSEQDPNQAIIRPSRGRGDKRGRGGRGRGRGGARDRGSRGRSTTRAASQALPEMEQDIEMDPNHNLLLLQGFNNGEEQPSQYGNSGSQNRRQPEQPQRPQMYGNYETTRSYQQTSAYNHTSDYSFLRNGPPMASHNQTNPYHDGGYNHQQPEISPIKFETRLSPLLFQSYRPPGANNNHTGYPYRPQHPGDMGSRLNIPASGTFSYPRPILNNNSFQPPVPHHPPFQSAPTLPPQQTGYENGYDIFAPHQQQEAARTLQALRTPIKRGRMQEDEHAEEVTDYQTKQEESSGDETIDMGIEDSPVRRHVTRSPSRVGRR